MKGTILLAVDHTTLAKQVADMAADIASPANAIVVLHVHQVASGRFGQIVIEHEPGDHCVAEDIAKDLQNVDLNARPEHVEVPMGHVGQEIARIAEVIDAGLIVMGTGSRSDVASMTLGSTSHRVLHRAHRPILLVPSS